MTRFSSEGIMSAGLECTIRTPHDTIKWTDSQNRTQLITEMDEDHLYNLHQWLLGRSDTDSSLPSGGQGAKMARQGHDGKDQNGQAYARVYTAVSEELWNRALARRLVHTQEMEAEREARRQRAQDRLDELARQKQREVTQRAAEELRQYAFGIMAREADLGPPNKIAPYGWSEKHRREEYKRNGRRYSKIQVYRPGYTPEPPPDMDPPDNVGVDPIDISGATDLATCTGWRHNNVHKHDNAFYGLVEFDRNSQSQWCLSCERYLLPNEIDSVPFDDDHLYFLYRTGIGVTEKPTVCQHINGARRPARGIYRQCNDCGASVVLKFDDMHRPIYASVLK